MKTNIKIYSLLPILILTMMLVSSCNKENDGAGSNNNRPDRVGLLDENLNFGSEGGQQSARTTTQTWWMDAFFNFDGHDYTDFVYIGGGTRIDTTTYRAGWVSAQKIGLQEVKITVDKNTTKAKRKITLALTTGTFSEYIDIQQDAAQE